MHKRKKYAVSELLGIVYILMISTTLISAIYIWAPQQLNDRKDRIRSESMLNQFETIDSVLTELLGQGVGSSKVVTMMTDEGYIHLSQVGSRFVVFHPTIDDFDFTVEGLDIADDEYDNTLFTYYQEKIPDYFWDLADDDRKILFQIYDLIQPNSDEFISDSLYYPPQQQPLPITVRFNSEESDVYSEDTTYEWDFSDLGTSSQENPIFEFDEGEYEVSLTLDDGTNTHTFSKDIFIGDEDQAHAGFDVACSTGFSLPGFYSGLNTEFTSVSVPSYPNMLESYEWDFEPDIGTGAYSLVIHKFLEADEYDITLHIDDTGGNQAWKIHTLQVQNPPPIVSFTFSSPVVPDGDVILTSTTTDSEGGGPAIATRGDKGGLLAIDAIDPPGEFYAFWDDGTENGKYDVGEEILDWDPDNGDDASPSPGDQGYIIAFCPVSQNTPSEPYLFIDNNGDWKFDPNDNNGEGINYYDPDDPLLDFDKDGKFAEPYADAINGDQGGLWALYEFPQGSYFTQSNDPYIFKDNLIGDNMYTINEKIVNNNPNADALCYYWDIDYDGTPDFYGYDANSISFSPQSVYTDPLGVHTILLQVEDDAGGKSQQTHDIIVKDVGDSNLYTGFSIHFGTVPDPNPYNQSAYTAFLETKGAFNNRKMSILKGNATIYEIGGLLNFFYGEVKKEGELEIFLQCENSDTGQVDSCTHSYNIVKRPPRAWFQYDIINEIVVTSEIPLEGTIQIDVKIEDEEGVYITAGKIWVFDIGAVAYEAAFGQKDYRIILENGAVLSTVSQSGSVTDEPEIYDETRLEGIGTELVQIEGVASDFIMNIVQFLIDGEVTIGPGGGHHRFNIKLLENEVLENSIEYYSTLKMQVFGDEGSVWRRYFTSFQGFEDYFGDTIQYKTGDTTSNTFMLALSKFSLDVEVLS